MTPNLRDKTKSTVINRRHKRQRHLDSSSAEDLEVPKTKRKEAKKSSIVANKRHKKQTRLDSSSEEDLGQTRIEIDSSRDEDLMVHMPKRTKARQNKHAKTIKPHIKIADTEDASSLSSIDSAELYELEAKINFYYDEEVTEKMGIITSSHDAKEKEEGSKASVIHGGEDKPRRRNKEKGLDNVVTKTLGDLDGKEKRNVHSESLSAVERQQVKSNLKSKLKPEPISNSHSRWSEREKSARAESGEETD
ncbi:hypothetical protein BCR34DRAFT_600668 [Clohesyomyces aquaticus]|uniref:Uncharacterized protein n=1 Tax=Clohesyomyces aquaticus TaxID=1231657 RepID=A0A1Y1ZQF0_9PLEO|nr:hypothetical protein BCR34DRAFT_600668 [Clohesyomyces aquaticus]